MEKAEFYYEPFYVAKEKDLPLYQEIFLGYGMTRNTQVSVFLLFAFDLIINLLVLSGLRDDVIQLPLHGPLSLIWPPLRIQQPLLYPGMAKGSNQCQRAPVLDRAEPDALQEVQRHGLDDLWTTGAFDGMGQFE